jgi:hypothetical protein
MNFERVVVTFAAPGREPFVAFDGTAEALAFAMRAKFGPAFVDTIASQGVLSLWIDCTASGVPTEVSLGWLDPTSPSGGQAAQATRSAP